MTDFGSFDKSFDAKLVPDYIKFIQENYSNFIDYVDAVDKLERPTDEFKNLTQYHIAALKDETYYETYRSSVKERTGEDLGKFDPK